MSLNWKKRFRIKIIGISKKKQTKGSNCNPINRTLPKKFSANLRIQWFLRYHLTECSPVCCSSSLQYFSYHFFCKHQKWQGRHCINIQSTSHREHRASFCCQEKLMLSQQLNQCFAITEYCYKDAYESNSLKK